MTLAVRSNFIHSDMQVPNSYTANISTAQNTVFLCVQFQCTKPTHLDMFWIGKKCVQRVPALPAFWDLEKNRVT